MKDLLRISDLSLVDLDLLLDLAGRFKRHPYQHRSELRNETVVLYFDKPSTRTRLSLATAVARLGGIPVVVRADELQLGRGETIEDTARSMSHLTRMFIARICRDEDLRREEAREEQVRQRARERVQELAKAVYEARKPGVGEGDEGEEL